MMSIWTAGRVVCHRCECGAADQAQRRRRAGPTVVEPVRGSKVLRRPPMMVYQVPVPGSIEMVQASRPVDPIAGEETPDSVTLCRLPSLIVRKLPETGSH